MEPLVISPQKEQKTVWIIIWLIWSLIIVLPLAAGTIFIPDIYRQIVFGIILALAVIVVLLWGIWIPYYWSSLTYSIDTDTVKMNGGVFWKKRVTVPFRKITNVDISQGPLQRKYNVGTIHVQTAGAGGAQGGYAELRFVGISKLDELKEIIMDGIRGYSAPPQSKNAHISYRDENDTSAILRDILEELRALRADIGGK